MQQQAAALTMLAAILGGNGQTSVMGRKLTFDSKTALYTSAFYDGTSFDDTTFGLVVVPAEGVTLQAAEDAMDGVIADFLKTGVDDGQFARIKAQITAAIIYGKDSTESLARQYGEALTSGLTVQDVQAWPDALQAVTEEEVMAAARAVFDRKQSVTGWLMKDDAAEVVQ
jgi:zinc protease